MRWFRRFALSAWVIVFVRTAAAETQDFQPVRTIFLAARVASVAGSDIRTILVVHDPDLALNAETAERVVVASRENAFVVDGSALTATPVDVKALPRFSKDQLVYVTSGLDDRHADIAEAARSSGALVVSGDLDCVRGGFCVLGVSLLPRTQMYLSRGAAESAGLSFGANFRAFVKEID